MKGATGRPSNTARQHQRGVAAVEFALVLSVLLLLIYGIATFGAALYVQQSVARAAEDGARAAPMRPKLLLPAENASAIEEIKSVVRDSLAGSLVAPQAVSATHASRRAWITSTVDISVEPVAASRAITVTVRYPYSANRILPSLPLLDMSRWMPETLTSHATAELSF